jgi:hypothetical protein
MGCLSCQQNNHVVSSTHAHNLTALTLCECACGCEKPICSTPEPCTDILDSKCIIYTDATIECSNDTVVTQNASVSTALNQIVNYFCAQNKKKFVKEITIPFLPDLLTINILASEYLPCLVSSEYCGDVTPSLADIIVTGYYYDGLDGYWKEFTHLDRTVVGVDNLGNVIIQPSFLELVTPINLRIIITN